MADTLQTDDNETMVSPPGMAMRSGTKKRRRSPKTTGLTPPEEVEAKRRGRLAAASGTPAAKRLRTKRNVAADTPAAVNDNDMDAEAEQGVVVLDANDTVKAEGATNDVTMDDAEKGTEPNDQDVTATDQNANDVVVIDTNQTETTSTGEKGALVEASLDGAVPTNGHRKVSTATVTTESDDAAAAATGAQQQRVPPIDKLRMPSKYTPGKAPEETKRLDPETPYNYGGPKRLFQAGQMTVEQSAAEGTAQERVEPKLAKQQSTTNETVVPKIPTQQQEDTDETAGKVPSPLEKTLVWCFILLVLQAIFWPVWINPIFTQLMEVSDGSILYLKTVAGIPPVTEYHDKVITKTEYVKRNATDPPEVIEVEIEVEGKAINPNTAILENLLQALSQTREKYNDEVRSLEDTSSELHEALGSKETARMTWETAVRKMETNLKSIIDSEEELEPRAGLDDFLLGIVNDVRQLEQLAGGKTLNPSLVRIDGVEMWETSSEPCTKPPVPAKEDSTVSAEDLARYRQELLQLSTQSVSSVVSEESLVDAVDVFFQDEVNAIVEEHMPEESNELVFGIDETTAQSAIHERMEVERADGTGKPDYAMMQAGAAIIRSGPRATSPSLIDSLPVLNRLMANAKVRFYGHGLEAALIPFVSANALGQCWGFESVTNHREERWRYSYRDDPSNGRFGTLTIRLSEPIQPGSVMIEHIQPAQRRRRTSSAIRDFRVVGYVEDDASGHPYPLGGFRYDNMSNLSAQSFEVAQDVNGRPVPALQSITLAIDSNWGAEYACLYRFRVME